ncbi:MAG: hypothetical protein OEX02_16755 [Cyclobacteriaceae bacterium]|nr:hypothetical protein [Cyclobacteriaceae bacterium]
MKSLLSYVNIILLIFSFGLFNIQASHAQNKGLYLGASPSISYEKHTVGIYGVNNQGLEKRTSKTSNTGWGVKAMYAWQRSSLGVGLAYVKRKYAVIRPYNHCFFNAPGEGCTFILAHVESYNYKTLEVPLFFNQKLFSFKGLTGSAGATWVNAFYYKREYEPYIPKTGTKVYQHDLTSFSKQINGQINIFWQASERWLFNLQPFVRFYARQRGDGILFEDSEWMVPQGRFWGVYGEVYYHIFHP